MVSGETVGGVVNHTVGEVVVRFASFIWPLLLLLLLTVMLLIGVEVGASVGSALTEEDTPITCVENMRWSSCSISHSESIITICHIIDTLQDGRRIVHNEYLPTRCRA